MPSFELLDSVVLSVPGGGVTTSGAVVVVDVVLDVVVWAKAAPVIRNRAQALAVRYFFIVTSIGFAEQFEGALQGQRQLDRAEADMGEGGGVYQGRKLLRGGG